MSTGCSLSSGINWRGKKPLRKAFATFVELIGYQIPETGPERRCELGRKRGKYPKGAQKGSPDAQKLRHWSNMFPHDFMGKNGQNYHHKPPKRKEPKKSELRLFLTALVRIS